jgi:hypothetical protein
VKKKEISLYLTSRILLLKCSALSIESFLLALVLAMLHIGRSGQQSANCQLFKPIHLLLAVDMSPVVREINPWRMLLLAASHRSS